MSVCVVHRELGKLGIDPGRLPAAELYTWPALRLAWLIYRLGRKLERRGGLWSDARSGTRDSVGNGGGA